MVQIFSYNVKGLNTARKRYAIQTELRRAGAHIAFLQETHLKSGRSHNLCNNFYKFQYHSLSPDTRSRGVAVLISKELHWEEVEWRSDGEGRSLMVKGKIDRQEITLATCYCPNEGQIGFLRQFLETLADFTSGTLVFGGDLNMVMDPGLDCSSNRSAISFRQLKSIKKKLYEMQLIDVWRICHPKLKDYTFYSRVHDCYSRIDVLFVTHKDLEMITTTTIGQITLSDHAPVSMSLELKNQPLQRPKWKLNEALLQDVSILQDLKDKTDEFFEINATAEISPLMLWGAYKCYIRGLLIKFGAKRKRQQLYEMQTLLTEIHKLESRHKTYQSQEILSALTTARERLRLLCLNKAKMDLTRCRSIFYEHGDKSGRMLARAIRGQRTKSFIPFIQTQEGRRVDSSTEIAKVFKSFYEKLYNLSSQEEIAGEPEIKNFLENSGMPCLHQEEAEAMEGLITPEEYESALGGSRAGRAPGPDGFPLSFFKALKDQLTPWFLRAFNSLRSLPPSTVDLYRATITLIHKEGKDPGLCDSYRPIALLNSDLKLFAKIIAERMQRFIFKLIHNDQVGFVPGREGRDNTTRVLDLIYHAQKKIYRQCSLRLTQIKHLTGLVGLI